MLRTDRTTTPILERFTLTGGPVLAVSGETLRVPPGSALEVQVAVRMSDQGRLKYAEGFQSVRLLLDL